MHTRRQARISALQALYELDTTNHNAADAIAHRVEDSQLPPEGEAFLRQLVSGVVVNRDRLDALIHRYAPAWPVAQIAVIDRNVLRIAPPLSVTEAEIDEGFTVIAGALRAAEAAG